MEELHDLPGEAPDAGFAEAMRGGACTVSVTWEEFLSTNVARRWLNVGAIDSPFSGALADTCSAIVDEIADLDRAEAKHQAWKIERIDEARRVAEATLHGVRVLGSNLSPAKQEEMARRSLVAELACALRLPETTVIGMIIDAEALMHRLPATMDTLRAGEISYRHARVLVEQTATLTPDAALLLEEQALPSAKTLTVSKFRAKTRLLRETLDPESITARVQKSAQDRRLDFEPANDGMAWLSLYTTAPEADAIYSGVRDYAIAAKTADDPRTLTQLTADVFTDAMLTALTGDLPTPERDTDGGAGPNTAADAPADGSTEAESTGTGNTPSGSTGSANSTGRPRTDFGSGAAFRKITPTVTVTVPALTLLGVTDDPAILDGYGPIDADTARTLAGQSTTWYRMLTDPKTGAPIAADRTKYRPTKAMKRYLRYVDGTCRFPGCNRRARHCDLDHTNDHAHGGPTRCENLSHLCPKHHRLKHQTTWKVKQLSAGTLEWTSPGGHNYITHPDVLLTQPEPPPKNAPRSRQEPLPPPSRPTLPPDTGDIPPF
jgi:hypothetical protein